MPSKSPASTTFHEPSMESSVLVAGREKSDRSEGKGEEEEEGGEAAGPPAPPASAPAAAGGAEAAAAAEPAAASASLSSSPGAHPLDHTTISPVPASSKHAAWWIRNPPSSASSATGRACCGCDWPRGATWTTILPVPILTHCAGPRAPTT